MELAPFDAVYHLNGERRAETFIVPDERTARFMVRHIAVGVDVESVEEVADEPRRTRLLQEFENQRAELAAA